jgi:hypothetical protein
VDAALGPFRGGQGDVEPFGSEAGSQARPLQLGLARRQRLLDLALEQVEGLAGLAAPLGARAQALHEPGDAAALAQRRDPDLVERPQVAGDAEPAHDLVAQAADVAVHHASLGMIAVGNEKGAVSAAPPPVRPGYP